MRNKILKSITSIFCIFCLALVLISCGEESKGGKTISFYTWGNETEISIFRTFYQTY